MDPFNFLKSLNGIPTPGGDGVRLTKGFGPYDHSLSTGLSITAATNPSIGLIETNELALIVAAAQTAGGTIVVEVPKDYDIVADEFKLNIVAVSAGTTDAPTLTATAYRKRAGTALTAALTVVASAAVPSSTAKAAERTVGLSGNGLLPGDILTINIVTGAHATDAINLLHTEVQFKSSIVFSVFNNRF